jgi:hypothetical protein
LGFIALDGSFGVDFIVAVEAAFSILFQAAIVVVRETALVKLMSLGLGCCVEGD